MSTESKPFSSLPKSISALIARLTRITSNPSGLDASLMLAQYSSPIVISLLVALAKWRQAHPHVHLSLNHAGKPVGGDSGKALVALAEGIGRAAGTVGDARVVMRAFGLLAMLDWLLKLHPRPVSALAALVRAPKTSDFDLSNEKVHSTARIVVLIAYFILEHTAWLGAKGVLPLSPATIGRASLWSVRCWAIDVLLTVIKLARSYTALKTRTLALKKSVAKVSKSHSAAEAYELQDNASPGEASSSSSSSDLDAQRAALTADWAAWKQQTVVNLGYFPLTLHWSTPGGLWSTPVLTGALGSVAAIGRLAGEWAKSA